MNFPYNNFPMQQYHAGYFREEQNKAYNAAKADDPDELLNEPTKKIKSEKSSEYSYPNGNPTFPYSQTNNPQEYNQNNQLKMSMQNMMYQNPNFQAHAAAANQKAWGNHLSTLNSTDQRNAAPEKITPKPETTTAQSGEGQGQANFQQNNMMQNQYAQAMMANYYSAMQNSMQNSAQAAQLKLYMQQQQQKYLNANANANPYMNMAQVQAAQQAHFWKNLAQMKNQMEAQRSMNQASYQNFANGSNSSMENTNSAQTQSQNQVQDPMQFLKEASNKPQEVEAKPQPQIRADLAAKGIHININGPSTKMSQIEKQPNKNSSEETEYKNARNLSTDFPEEDKTTMISPTSFQVQDTNKIEGTAPAPIFDDIYFDLNMANLDKFFDADGIIDFNTEEAKKNDDKKSQPAAAPKGRGRPKKDKEAKNNKESKPPKEAKEPKEKKPKKKGKELVSPFDKKEEATFGVESFLNPSNQMQFNPVHMSESFMSNKIEIEAFPPVQSMNEISSVPPQTQKDLKEKIPLPEINPVNSLVKEQPRLGNPSSMMHPYMPNENELVQNDDLFENFEFDFQDAENFDFDDGTFNFEPFDETKLEEEQQDPTTGQMIPQPARKRGRPRKYAPDGSLLIKDGSESLVRPLKKTTKLQAEREAYEKYLEELKKPYVIHIHHNEDDPEQKVNNTRVGDDHQLFVPPFERSQEIGRKKRLSPLWAPDMATQEFLDSYLKRLEAVVGQKITYQGAALRVLKIYNMRVDDVLENVKISPKYYQNYFKVNHRSAKNRFNH